MAEPIPFGLNSTQAGQLVRLQRRPIEAPNSNSTLRHLHRAGFASCRPLSRPSGTPSQYREWAITDHGREALEILKEVHHGW